MHHPLHCIPNSRPKLKQALTTQAGTRKAKTSSSSRLRQLSEGRGMGMDSIVQRSAPPIANIPWLARGYPCRLPRVVLSLDKQRTASLVITGGHRNFDDVWNGRVSSLLRFASFVNRGQLRGMSDPEDIEDVKLSHSFGTKGRLGRLQRDMDPLMRRTHSHTPSEPNIEDREYEVTLHGHEEYGKTLNEEKEYEVTLIDSPVLPAKSVPTRSWFHSTNTLRLVSLTLHSLLVAIHLGLLVVWSKNLEHRVVFSLDRQRTVSFILTAVTTTFGTTYSALLVFLTQTLSTRRSLQIKQTVTAIHDSAAAWAGIGSAILHLWRQTAVRGSTFGVLSALVYLGNILVLHITTPALFSVVAFNSSRDILVQTELHMPVYNWSENAQSDIGDDGPLTKHMIGALYSIPSVLGNSTSPGLHEGTLHDTLANNEGVGSVAVNATGFNVTCGYPPHVNLTRGPVTYSWWGVSVTPPDRNFSTLDIVGESILSSFVKFPLTLGEVKVNYGTDSPPDSDIDSKADSSNRIGRESIQKKPGMIRVVKDGSVTALMLYSTITIVDSSDKPPPMPDLSQPLNATPPDPHSQKEFYLPTIPILRCALTLVPQQVLLEARTNTVISVEPSIRKTSSTWAEYTGPVTDPDRLDPTNTSTGNLFIDLWMVWYTKIPSTAFLIAVVNNDEAVFASAADMYLIQQLNLHTPNSVFSPNDTVALHDVENALSRLVAAMFWTSTHMAPWLEPGESYAITDYADSTTFTTIAPPEDILPLAQGVTAVAVALTEGRLDSSPIAIIVGLTASIFLTLLAIPSMPSHRDADTLIDGTGVLHTIWMYRNHPELDVLLPQIEYPTNENLRRAGTVRTRLVGGRARESGDKV
ncbi:hypothetical protein C8R46DRAFT_1040834 [Mycena filopes]|nr:hypothetical protein C8R46DRAFT_1040834 [Mycena filopes]